MAYTPTNWSAGDTITAEKLNNMEGGISANDTALTPFIVTLIPTSLDYSGTMDKTVAEIYAAHVAGRKIVYKVIMSETRRIYADVTMVYFNDDFEYPSFNAFIIDDDHNLLIEAATLTTDTGTINTYATAVYTLTPMS